jgi:hypothetical protein
MDKVKDAVQNKLMERREYEYALYHKMFDITLKFIQKEKLLMYGGSALNMILPAYDRFYTEHELPDYDFFAPKALEVAKRLADEYVDLGYKYVYIKQGVHYNTYKLYVDLLPIADISDMPLRVFERMKEVSYKERELLRSINPDLKVLIAPLNFLRLAMHLELSRPDGFIERWPKIYERMQLLYKHYPLELSPCPLFEHTCNHVDAVNSILKYAKTHNIMVIGEIAAKKHLGIKNDNNLSNTMAPVELVSLNYHTHVEKIFKLLQQKNTTVRTQSHAPLGKSQFIPRHTEIRVNGKIVCIVYQTNACYSFLERDGIMIGTIDTLLSFWYAMTFARRNYYDNNLISCLIASLHKVLKDDERYKTKCYGKQLSVRDIKKHRIDAGRSLIIYKPKYFLTNKTYRK